MSQREAKIIELQHGVDRALWASHITANVQKRIVELRQKSDDQYLAEMRPRGGAQL